MMTTHKVHNEPVPEEAKHSKPGILNLFLCKCPRCRKGAMFTNPNPYDLRQTMKMNKECPVCKQPFNLEVGFYYGSSYISYGFSIAISIATFIAWWFLIGFSLEDSRFFYWIAFNAIFLLLLQPYLMRVSRTGWLAIFTKYDPDWQINPPQAPERTNATEENNW
jgi:hypothetical protein